MNISIYNDSTNKYLEQISPEIVQWRNIMVEQVRKNNIYTPLPKSEADSHKFGWIRGYTLELETLLHGNWYHWLNVIEQGEYIKEKNSFNKTQLYPITSSSPVTKMLKKCMDSHLAYRVNGTLLLEWIGYGLGISYFNKPKISNELWNYWYNTFDISLLLIYPADYLSHFLIEYGGQSGRYDFYPTTNSLTTLLQRLVSDEQAITTDSVFEPCCGTGSLLLESNSINLIAADLNYTMVQAMAIHAFLYLPYLLYVPCPILNIHVSKEEQRVIKYYEFDTDTRIYHGDSITGEYSSPTSIFKEKAEFTEIYLNPIEYEKNTTILSSIKYNGREWSQLSSKERIEVVIAQSRHIKIDHIITNPPFTKLPDTTIEKINKIHESNKGFLKRFSVVKGEIDTNTILKGITNEKLRTII